MVMVLKTPDCYIRKPFQLFINWCGDSEGDRVMVERNGLTHTEAVLLITGEWET